MWGNTTSSIADICHLLGLVSVSPHPSPVQHSVSWMALSLGTIKVNIDGSFASSRVGIGDIFHDHEGKPLLYFAKHVVVELATHAEILSIWEGLLVVVTSCRSSSSSFIFEPDSTNAVS